LIDFCRLSSIIRAMKMCSDDYWQWLDSFIRYRQAPRRRERQLEMMSYLCRLFGQPQAAYECWHVAGSKGKGSVSAMIAAILSSEGETVGLYQSPHVSDWRERIRTATGFFPDEVYLQAMQELYSQRQRLDELEKSLGMAPTWFELVTLLAMLTFRQAGVRRAVFEVGLGGRLDATNVIQPVASVITPLEREHTEYLGETLAAIAAEKCGIIKQNVPVVTAAQPEAAMEVIRQTARRHQSSLVTAASAWRPQVKALTLAGMRMQLEAVVTGEIINAQLPLLGEHQAENAALAVTAVRTIYPDWPGERIAAGLSTVWLPGRWEIVAPAPGRDGVPALVLDGAHTPRSLTATIQIWKKVYPQILRQYGKPGGRGDRVLFACAADKDIPVLAQLICANFAQITLTRPGEYKQTNLAALQAALTLGGRPVTVEPDVSLAIAGAMTAAVQAGEPLLVTGSFYLLGEVKSWLAHQAADELPQNLLE